MLYRFFYNIGIGKVKALDLMPSWISSAQKHFLNTIEELLVMI